MKVYRHRVTKSLVRHKFTTESHSFPVKFSGVQFKFSKYMFKENKGKLYAFKNNQPYAIPLVVYEYSSGKMMCKNEDDFHARYERVSEK